jgi:CRISPR-associated protein Csb3
MSQKEANIIIPVDLNNPGQFYACCGLLELADRLWHGAEGWFESVDQFALWTEAHGASMEPLCKAIIESELKPLLPADELKQLDELNKRKADLKKRKKSLPKNEETIRKRLNSKRIASGFHLGSPFNLRVDWWLVEDCDGDHLKTWAGQQAICGIADAIKAALTVVPGDAILGTEKVVRRQSDGETVAPLSFDSGRAGTAQDIGYSPDKIGQALTCCVWTEFLTLIALQRFALKPDSNGFFTYHVWCEPLPVCVAAVAVRGQFPQVSACEGRFRLPGRDSGNRYKAFQQATLTEWRST